MPLDFYRDVVARAKRGPIMRERDFEMELLVPKLREVQEKYSIKYDPSTPVPSDDSLADAIYRAAVEFYAAVGAYCIDTNRVIQFTEDEIEEAVQASPSEVAFGEGLDQRIVTHRKVEDDRRPPLWITANASTVTQDRFFPIVQTFLEEPLCDLYNCPHVQVIDGIEIGVGDPTEYFGASRLAAMFNEARRRAGRPGIAVMNAGVAGPTGMGTLAAARPENGLTKNDGWTGGPISEFKVDFHRLTKAAFLIDWNAIRKWTVSPILGAYLGGPEGVAIGNVAYHLMGATLSKITYCTSLPLHFTMSNNTHRATLWAVNASHQAVARNTPCISFAQLVTRFGPGTDMIIYEGAAWALGAMPSGGIPSLIGFAGGGKPNRMNPLDAKLVAEICLAVVGMTREEANPLADRFIKMYEDKLSEPDLGYFYDDLYDPETLKPKPETLERYHRQKAELEELGIPFRRT
jgi:methylamine--corrinoid protein Co-methyltransferase